MLGRLAKWLRAAGLDTLYLGQDLHPAVKRRAARGRVFVTRDTRLAARWRSTPLVLLTAVDLTGQMEQLLPRLNLDTARLKSFSRCLVCNLELEKARPETVARAVPEYVQRTATRFRRCPGCGRVFWQGTHHRNMIRVLSGLGIYNPLDHLTLKR